MSLVRLVKTPELEEVLSYLRVKYRLLSEADIIKMILSDRYYKEIKEDELEDKSSRKHIKAFLDEYHKTIPEVDEEEAMKDILEAQHAVRKEQ
jgi:hypothetical protein